MSSMKKRCSTDYTEEIFCTMLQKENQRIPFLKQSPQFSYRHILVNWLRGVAEQLKLNNTSVHVAVYLLDIFMDNHRIIEERLNLVALVCILLAAKFEERDSNVPKISDLNAHVGNQYPTTDFISLEFMILHFMRWSMAVPTAAHFAEHFTVFSTLSSDMDSAPSNLTTYQELQSSVHQHIRDFLDYSLQEESLIVEKPSRVAASCIAAARQTFYLSPVWPDVLQNITKYQYKDLEPVVKLFLSNNSKTLTNEKKRKLTESPDHGYATADSATNSPEICKRSRRS